MDGLSIVSAVSGVLVGTVKTAEKAYEITAVDEQAKALLQTVGQVSGQLNDARALRRQKSALFSATEKRIFEESFRHTDDALRKVAILAEPARADMSVSKGPKERVRLNTRLMYVLRDSPNVQVQLTQLGIASQSLNATLVTLMGREGRSRSLGSLGAASDPVRPPPSYEDTMFLHERRQRNIARRTSNMSLGAQSPSTSPIVTPPEDFSSDIAELRADERAGIPSSSIGSRPEPMRSASARTYQDNEFLSANRTRNSQRRARSEHMSRPVTPSSPLPQVPENISELAGNECFDEARSIISEVPSYEEMYSPIRGPVDPARFDSAAPQQVRDCGVSMGRARSQRWLEARCR